MRLRITTPLSVVVDDDIDALRAEDPSGGFGVLPGHAPFLTVLSVSILSWRKAGIEHFCALRGGVMVVGAGSAVDVATREAVVGEDLATLDAEVLARFRADIDAERTEHTETMRLHVDAIRRMVSRLRASANTGALR